ncbi:MAG: hypothetical protein ABIH59_02780 [archaeon]
MPKKAAKKRTTKKKRVSKITPTVIQVAAPKEAGVSKIMLENFVSLQKVMTNLSIKLDNLTTQISKLLELFEISAKALAEKDFEIEKDSRDVIDKMDRLLDQNKILAKGVSLMHERMPLKQFPPPMPQPPISPPQMQPSPFTPRNSLYMQEISPTPMSLPPNTLSSTPSLHQKPKKPLSKEISPSQMQPSLGPGDFPPLISEEPPKSPFESPMED